KHYNITDIEVDLQKDPDAKAVARDIEICIQHIEENNLDIEWLLWFSHDCYLIGDDFLTNLEKKLEDNPRFEDEVGMIGFCDYNQIEVGKPLHGRGELVKGINEIGNGWYQDLPKEYSESEYFVVEAPNDNGLLVNIKLWKKYIKPDNDFVLFFWGDDICAQFALNGIASITIPSLEMADLYRDKPAFGVTRSLSSNPRFHTENYANDPNNPPWERNWYKKYKFKRAIIEHWSTNPIRKEFLEASDMYKGSIQEKIFNWHINDGPKTLDDLK
ncbi:MAG TPA: hypothetical protein DCM40_16005, partial [Maribacter sp.]|nr:hypothetical protein [Maribacter sp.]